LELARKTTPKKNLRSMIRTRVEIPELDKKIEQPKKIEGCNQEKDRKILQYGDDNVRQKSQSNVWMLRLKPRTRPTIQEIQQENTKGS
jgi:hypothetical protein